MSVSLEKLRQTVERLEALEQQKADLMDDVRDVMAEAKNEGFDLKVLRQVLKVRKMKPEDLSEQEELLSLYLNALQER
jgi:uncharacterized protein (UPF0335 family)